MVELVTIPVSFLEITIDYEKPDLCLLGERAPLLQGIFEALLPWNANVDDIELVTGGRISEQGVIFKLPQKHISFFMGVNFCRFSRNAVNWDMVEETVTILDAAVSALAKLSGVVMGTKRSAIGIHLQPRVLPFIEVLRPFVPAQLMGLEAEPIMTMATVAKWSGRRVTIDGSASVANGVFVKLERDFVSSTPYDVMARQLWKDEQDMFVIMGVKEDRP